MKKPAPGEPWQVPATPAPAPAAAGRSPGRTGRSRSRSRSRPPRDRPDERTSPPWPAPPHRIDVLTLFPALFDGFLSQSILSRAIAKGLVAIERWDIRDWAEGKHKQVDDRPFGGGPGMVLMAPPVVAAAEAVAALAEPPGRLILLSPQGRRLDQPRVAELAREPRLILLCGRYEGFDERIIEILEPELLSVGDYILSGGEVAAMVVIDAVVRLIPGVLGDAQSADRRVVRTRWRTRISPVHPASRLPRPGRPRDPPERRPRRDRRWRRGIGGESRQRSKRTTRW